jgi:cytochrome c-type biogenesis protein CcmE
MKPKRRRLYLLLGSLAGLGVATALVLSAFEDNLVFFYSPSDLKTKSIAPERRFRLGGLVEAGSVARDGTTVRFSVTDGAHSVAVTYTGILPDLFREGQGVVTEGALGADGAFRAASVLAKHDESYMPREVADALKAAGQWKGAPSPSAPAKP